MCNYKIKLKISPNDIFNKLSYNDKKRFNSIEILNTTLLQEGSVIIECLISENKIKDTEYLQHLFSDGDLIIEKSNI